ncbi:SIR2 family protein [Crassaminicella profunda]|uniref:SIR2 family protein n=1 Tax=Crassaminicella profunda TaxID=1286698 RepID=UPI001CA63919|nr:SIR2 family protein [Crassaminicella profunda]QZY56674.1 SIR2 family protein [Crassaminicella profunda]
MENTVLFGNGVNRVNSANLSWEELLKNISGDKNSSSRLPNTINYEHIFLKRNDTILFHDAELKLKRKIVEELNKIEPSDLHYKIGELPASNFLTTNYDYAFNVSLKQFSELPYKDNSEKLYSIRRNNSYIKDNNSTFKVWNIHGELNNPKSIMLGLDHYCGSIGKIDQYVKGTYRIGKKVVKHMKEKLLGLEEWDNISWVELFFNSNVYILGFGLDYSEIDLWWILNKRARMCKSKELKDRITNEIIFYGNVDEDKQLLLESFNVEVINKKDNSWDKFYSTVIEDIKKRINTSKLPLDYDTQYNNIETKEIV